MAFEVLSHLNATPFVQTAFEEGGIPEHSFAFKLAPDASELYLGGDNKDLYKGELEHHQVLEPRYWTLNASTFLHNGTPMFTDLATILDTGTSVIAGPPEAVYDFFSAFPGDVGVIPSLGQTLYAIPCNSTEEIAFKWDDGKEWKIKPEDFIYGKVDDLCVAGLIGADLGLGNTTWLLGDTFLRGVYSKYTVDPPSVAFAELA